MPLSLAERAAALLGIGVRRELPMSGGDLSEVVALALDDGREAIVKGGPSPATEAAMLEAIAATGAPAPAVLGSDAAILVLERLPAGGRIDAAWSDLGSALGKLHAASDVRQRYGWHADYAFGQVAIENAWSDLWPGFWAESRLVNQLPYLPRDIAARVEALARSLGDRLPARPTPALLHGDLWGGNILVAGSRISGLIDPACYYGDREVDFAMLCLFNRPGQALFAASGALEPGHEARLPIYQLWPALVHLRLFGSAYRSMVEGLLSAAGV
jgi:fructosamine-3-kinase